MWTVLKREQPTTPSLSARWLAGVVVAIVLLTVMLVGDKVGTLQSDLALSVETAATEQSTLLWRVEGWKYLLDAQGASLSDLVFGRPFGAGYQRKVFGNAVNYSPHSLYVQTILRVGLVGFALMLMALWAVFRRGLVAGLLPRNLGALIVISTVVYGVAYQPAETQGILLGVVAVAGRRLKESETPESSDGTAAESPVLARQPGNAC